MQTDAHVEGRGGDLGLPRLIFVNKLDRERASFERTLEELQAAFGAGVAPLELPIGEEAAFRGVADLLSDTAITYDGGRPTTGPIPDDMAGQEHSVHDALVEGIVVADDDLMERYLEGETPSVKQLEETLAHGRGGGSGLPGGVRVGDQGDRRRPPGHLHLRDRTFAPRPARPSASRRGAAPSEVAPDPDGPPSGLGVEDRRRPARGQDQPVQGAVRVGSGPTTPWSTPAPTPTSASTPPSPCAARSSCSVSELPVGDLGAVAKLADVVTGDTLAPKGTPVRDPAPTRARTGPAGGDPARSPRATRTSS